VTLVEEADLVVRSAEKPDRDTRRVEADLVDLDVRDRAAADRSSGKWGLR